MTREEYERLMPPELQEKVQRIIDTDPSYAELRRKKDMLCQRGDFLGALRYAKMMEEVNLRVKQSVLEEAARESAEIRVLMTDMSLDDQMELSISMNLILFAIDQIDLHVTNANSIIKKYYPDYTLIMYDKLMKIGEEVKKQVSYMGKHERIDLQVVFADIADSLSELLINKVKAYIRRKKGKENQLI